MVGVYVRVSTESQEDNYSYKDQEDRGRKFAADIGEDVEVYKEAKSGTTLEGRQEWSRLISDVRSGLIDKIWVLDNKRFSRNVLDAIQMLKECKKNGVTLFIDNKQLDYTDYREIFQFQILSAIAEFDRNDKIDKSTTGIRKSIDSGNKANSRLYGYQRQFDENGNIVRTINQEQAETVKRMFDLFLKGSSIRQVCVQLNSEGFRTYEGKYFYGATVGRMLRNPRYAGFSYNTKGELIKSNVYPPIITKEIWEDTQKLLVQNNPLGSKKRGRHISSGVLHCGKCGFPYHYHPMSDKRNKKKGTFKRHYYQHDYHGPKCDQRPKLIPAQLLDQIFSILYVDCQSDYETIKKLYQNKEAEIAKEKNAVVKAIERINKGIIELNRKKNNLINAIADGTVSNTDVSSKLIEINSELNQFERQKLDQSSAIKKKEEQYHLLLVEFGVENVRKWIESSEMIKREMLKRLIETAVTNGYLIKVKMATGKLYEIDLNNLPEFIKRRIELSMIAQAQVTALESIKDEKTRSEMKEKFISQLQEIYADWKEGAALLFEALSG